MKFVFDYEEILSRRITIDADNLSEAIKEIENRIDTEEIVLCSEDFVGGKITMPLEENFLPHLEHYGESMEPQQGVNVVIDFW